MEGIHTIGHEWDRPSFPSAHAHLWLQATVLFGVVFRSWRWPLIVLSALVCYARPYAGVHHVLDVIAGIGLGTAIGLLDIAAASALGLLPWKPPEQGDEPEDDRDGADGEANGTCEARASGALDP